MTPHNIDGRIRHTLVMFMFRDDENTVVVHELVTLTWSYGTNYAYNP